MKELNIKGKLTSIVMWHKASEELPAKSGIYLISVNETACEWEDVDGTILSSPEVDYVRQAELSINSRGTRFWEFLGEDGDRICTVGERKDFKETGTLTITAWAEMPMAYKE